MDTRIVRELEQNLSRRRSALLRDLIETTGEKAILEEQESELEEIAQKDRITRLTSRFKERDRQKLREIDAALDRLTAGLYGKCEKCGQEIGIDRLRALPTATLCINCAAARESKKQQTGAEEPSERLPGRHREDKEFGEE
jgi:RNA polymerase-binding protein DksA